MRHRKKSEKFSRSRAQRKALVKSLLKALIVNERIVTTASRAKYLRAEVDKLITLGKRGRVSDRRLAFDLLGDRTLVRKLFDAIAPRYPQNSGGYTRVLRMGRRKGDGALLSMLELTKIEKKIKKHREAKDKKAQKSSEEKTKEKQPKQDRKAKTGIASKVKNIFKKDRD
ncbi:MAG: 50S ribosomal protein L17 [Candidatus Omnitrophica bacterium]|nr:50S ribosomal protein L17 [Candidatus Omnitrophota bacterium]